jgi:hypothetical protein
VIVENTEFNPDTPLPLVVVPDEIVAPAPPVPTVTVIGVSSVTSNPVAVL